jgi:hypothetical protein
MIIANVKYFGGEFDTCFKLDRTDGDFVIADELIFGVTIKKTAFARSRVSDHYQLEHRLADGRLPTPCFWNHDILLNKYKILL